MAVTVTLRFNKLTGEVEEFLVDQDQEQPRAQHDQSHEQVAGELGRLIERFPRVVELTGTAPQVVDPEERSETGDESTDEESSARPEVRRRR